MKILVCAKHVPDPNHPMEVDIDTRRLVRNPAQSILDPGDEFGIEAALQLVEQHGGEVVAVSMGPEAAEDGLRRAMAMGVGRAILVTDGGLENSDALATARTLAAVIKEEEPDLIICATESTDAYTGMVPGMMAALLNLPQITFVRSIEVEGENVTVQRDYENGYQSLRAPLPALMTVTASIAEPRYPSFKGMMQAKRKPIDRKDLASLGLEASQVGDVGSKERVMQIERVQQQKQVRKIEDDGTGDSVDEIVKFLKDVQAI